MTTNIAHSTGRHRRDGSRPSGKSTTRKNSSSTVSKATVPDNQPASRATGTEPGAVASPYTAYCSVTMVTASDSPTRPSSQPMALPGRRLTIRRPVPAYNPTERPSRP